MSAPVIIIGAGPGGLAVAACLQREGIADAVILEEADQVASSWRRHYERLHLHTPRSRSALPHLPMPRDFPRYPGRAQVIDYFEAYARHFSLTPRFGERVKSARRLGEAWEVTTPKGRYQAPVLVVAAGYNREPVIPTWPGMTDFGGPIKHSSAYANGRPYQGQDVLVVGFGNSGGEILATGYRPRVDHFLEAGAGVLDADGKPASSGTESAAAGLYFCGYHVSPNGMLREMALESRRIARAIKLAR